MALEIEALSTIPHLVQAGCGHAVVPESVLWAGWSGTELSVRQMVRPLLKGRLALVSASRRQPTLLVNGTEAMLRDLLKRTARATRPRH